MPDTGGPYFIPFLDGTELVRAYPALSEDLADAIVNALENIPVTQKKIQRFTGSGTWTVPAGVTYAIAHMQGGGGGAGISATGSDGGDSSVAFASGTVTGFGATKTVFQSRDRTTFSEAGRANTGENAQIATGAGNDMGAAAGGGSKAQYIVAGAAVTPGASVSVTVGAGGAAGTSGAAGGSGYVYIEYYEEV